MTLNVSRNTRKRTTHYYLYDDAGGMLARFNSLSDAAMCLRFLNGTSMSDGQTARAVQLLDAVDEAREKPGAGD